MSAFLLGLGFRADMGTTIRKLVLLKLIDACHDDGSKIFPALTTVAQAAQCSVRQVQREVKAFLDVGLLVMVREGGKGPGSTCEYQLDLDVLEVISKRGWDGLAAPEDAANLPETAEKKGDTVSPLDCSGENKGDTGDTLRVTPTTAKGDSWSPTTPYYPLPDPSEREGAREAVLGREDHSDNEPARLAKRIKALELGRAKNPWPGALNSSTTWALQQFRKLSPEERLLAEERRDAYLAACPRNRDGEPKAVPLGVYLRDRKFLDIEAIVPKAAPMTRIPVKPFGPVWAGLRQWAFIGGPVSIDIPLDLRDKVFQSYQALLRISDERGLAYLTGKSIQRDERGELLFPADFEEAEWRRRVLDEGYPEVIRLHNLARHRERGSADARAEGLGPLCEAVPVGSDLYEEWRLFHAETNRPFVPDPGTMPVVYFPKGGPDGLQDFERAARAVMTAGESDEHAA